jgi:hypothetical protein
MITRKNRISCNNCGKFVAYDDIADGLALHAYRISPGSLQESYESLCRRCYSDELERRRLEENA